MLHLIDSRACRANSLFTDKCLESVDNYNAKVRMMTRLNRLIVANIYESWPYALSSVRKFQNKSLLRK